MNYRMCSQIGEIISNAPIGRRRKRNYVDIVITFDIETTAIREKEMSITWAIQWYIEGYGAFMMRTWEQARYFINYLSRNAKKTDRRIAIYVHNLAYEWEFIRTAFPKWQYDDDIFFVDSRKPLYAVYDDAIEFRCSYLLSNMSLRTYLKRWNVEHKKTELDYEKVRYPWTELTEQEIEYCLNDVQGLGEAIRKEMYSNGDTVATIPYTSTGYIRRDVIQIMQGRKQWMKKTLAPFNIYSLLREAFRGGDTHANRYYVMDIIENVKSYDFSSSYPYELCSRLYPLGEWKQFKGQIFELEEMAKKINSAYICKVRLKEVRLKDKYNGMPYLPYSKMDKCVDWRLDNGRVLSCKECYITITDIDYKIIKEEYNIGFIEVIEAYTSEYRKLPKDIINYIVELFEKKTSLKGSDDPFEKEMYMKSKNKINAMYGLTVQDPVAIQELYSVTDDVYYIDDRYTKEELYQDYLDSFTGLPYQVGVWVTAYARYDLKQLQKIGAKSVIYVDTDSVKLKKPDKAVINAIELFNNERKIDKLSAVDRNGKVHYMGLAEFEGEYSKFITGGAKKYADVINGKFEITIAGVPKRIGAEMMQNIGNFKEGFIFKNCKNGIKYSEWTKKDCKIIDVDGHKLELTSYAYIYPTDYELSLTDEYRQLIKWLKGIIKTDEEDAIEEACKKMLEDYKVYNAAHIADYNND